MYDVPFHDGYGDRDGGGDPHYGFYFCFGNEVSGVDVGVDEDRGVDAGHMDLDLDEGDKGRDANCCC